MLQTEMLEDYKNTCEECIENNWNYWEMSKRLITNHAYGYAEE